MVWGNKGTCGVLGLRELCVHGVCLWAHVKVCMPAYAQVCVYGKFSSHAHAVCGDRASVYVQVCV